jgi:hypothetical protein
LILLGLVSFFCHEGITFKGRLCQNKSLLKGHRSLQKLNPARIGGARAANPKASRFATAHTKAPASGRSKLKSPRRKPSRGAAASIRKTARFVMGATDGSLEF